jgi:FkbM family methyltransferase
MIPKTVHFAFFYERDFPLYALLAVKSAQKFLNPGKILLYRGLEAPDFGGEWWEFAKDAVEIVRMRPPTEIFGRPLKHQAHQADVFRLQVLLEEGGIYLDMDTICCGSFDRLLDKKCVLGHQTRDQSYGLCNAVMLAERKSEFLQMWLDEYKSFRSAGHDEFWDEHSVQLPLRLARSLKSGGQNLVHMEPHTTFFAAGFLKNELERLFEDCEEFPTSLAHHLWASFSYKRYLMHLSPRMIMQVPTSYNLVARKVMELMDWTPQPGKPGCRTDPIGRVDETHFLHGKRKYRLLGRDNSEAVRSPNCREKTFCDLEMLEFVRDRRLCGTYVDVGAGIGNHSLYFLGETECSRLVAIEGDPKPLAFLRLNVPATAQDGQRCQILNEIVTYRPAFFNPAQSVDGGYGSYFSKACLGEESVAVKPRTLDELLAGEKDIAFLRVGVGENLMDVLKSGENLLRKQSPAVCLQVAGCEDGYCEFMESLGYLPLITLPGQNIYFAPFPRLFIHSLSLVKKFPVGISSRVVWRIVRLYAILTGRLPLRMFRTLHERSLATTAR